MHDVDSSARLNVNKRGVVVDIELEAPAEALGEVEENVRSEEQLLRVPAAYLSGDASRPLIAHDAQGNAYSYVLRPMMYSVVLILLQEALERMAFYGVSNTIAPFLEGHYGTWNPGYSLAQALSLSSTTTALASTMPFVGALLADSVLGCYWTIVIFGVIAYLPGLLLIALSAKPYALGEEFNVPALLVGLLGLYPLGAGALKSCVNVFGAQQFHPVVQREQIKTYYVLFYGKSRPRHTRDDVFFLGSSSDHSRLRCARSDEKA
jgi:POT family proton-dependent oligopeptide transporter